MVYLLHIYYLYILLFVYLLFNINKYMLNRGSVLCWYSSSSILLLLLLEMSPRCWAGANLSDIGPWITYFVYTWR